MLKMDGNWKKELEKNVKTWVRERFGLYTLEFAEFVKGLVEASRKKTYFKIEDTKRRRIR